MSAGLEDACLVRAGNTRGARSGSSGDWGSAEKGPRAVRAGVRAAVGTPGRDTSSHRLIPNSPFPGSGMKLPPLAGPLEKGCV